MLQKLNSNQDSEIPVMLILKLLDQPFALLDPPLQPSKNRKAKQLNYTMGFYFMQINVNSLLHKIFQGRRSREHTIDVNRTGVAMDYSHFMTGI